MPPSPPDTAESDEALVDRLARAFHEPGDAKLLARRAGFVPGHIPVFEIS